jgi:uncharacterized protein (TIGR02145 family)
MKILKYIFIAFIWLESGHSALSQYYLKAKSDSISLESDSVLLFVDKYRGAVEWWVNPDLMDYNWMLLTSTNDTLGVRIDNSAYYRATITDGTCNPVMSDTVYIIEKLTITNSNQFTVNSMGGVFLLPSGIKVKIPRGAVTGPKEIRVDIISSDSVNKLAAVHYPEKISFLSGISVATDAFNFRKPIKIKIPLAAIDGLPVLFEFNNVSGSWFRSDETIIVDNGVMNMGVEERFVEIILKGSDKKGTTKKAESDLSLNDIRSFFLELYGDIFLREDYCRKLGYTVIAESRDTTGSGGCTAITITEEFEYWACDPPQRGTYSALVVSDECEPELSISPGDLKIRKGDMLQKVTLKAGIGDIPLQDQSINLEISGNIYCSPTQYSTNADGITWFGVIGDRVGYGSISIIALFSYYLNTIFASNNAGTEYNEYDLKLITKNYGIFVTVYDIPVVITVTPNDIICTSATVGGYVIDDNYDPVTERGVIFNGVKIQFGNGEGKFSGTLPGLTPGTTYTVMAYATNLAGTAYGDQISFTTKADDCVAVSSTILGDNTCICTCTSFSVRTKVSSDENELVTERGVYYGTSENPEITGIKYQSGSGTGSFIITFPDILQNTTYYVKGYAVLSSNTVIFGNLVSFSSSGTVTDVVGNVYKTISIGPQVWMAENLNTSLYNDGTPIPYIESPDGWAHATTGARCWDDNVYHPNLGAFYNYYAVNTGKLCPAGWHVPHSTVVEAMKSYLVAKGFNYDGTTTGNKIAKALASPAYWISSFYIGSIGNDVFPEKMNATCFSALPGGCRWGEWDVTGIGEGYFVGFGEVGYWWQSDIRTHFDLRHTGAELMEGQASGSAVGMSVRCVKDK